MSPLARNLDPKQQSDVLGVVDSTKTAMYILCGDGPHCAINEGKPSVARGTVLRREALELALYSFRYLDNTDSVVAFFPPQKGKNLNHVYFFAKTDFKDQLDAAASTSRCRSRSCTCRAASRRANAARSTH